jgi:hypothetical protein
VACDGDGLSVFDRLRYRREDGRVFLLAFDLLELNGRDMAIMRKPSSLISWIQSGPEGRRSAGEGRQGSINAETARVAPYPLLPSSSIQWPTISTNIAAKLAKFRGDPVGFVEWALV